MRILIVDDENRYAAVLARTLAYEGFDQVETAESAEEALRIIASAPFDLVITDLRLPRRSGLELMGEVRRRHPATAFVLMTAFADVATARDALKGGALDYLVKPFDTRELVALVRQAEARHLEARPAAPAAPAASASGAGFGGLLGASPAMARVCDELERAARSDVTVLLLGESGTGKELAANALHRGSARAGGPFVEAHLAALAESVLESELFGHEKGAFTGAERRKAGLFEAASGGTIFLDEIGEVPGHLQPKILRVLQERRFARVGGTEKVSVDVRLVAATNRVLADEVAAGRFREDLYYRLAVLTITQPPLRERGDDVRLLAEDFLRRRRPGAAFDGEALAALRAHRWPGNVRELANVVERALVLCDGEVVGRSHLPPGLGRGGEMVDVTPADGSALHLQGHERQLILQARQQAGGTKTRAADLLGITRRRLYSRLQRLGMAVDEDAD